MKVLVQRVLNASVEVGGRKVSAVGKGILAFVGVEKDDTAAHAAWMAQKICALRIFEDENGKMNLSVRDIGGEILAVSQFTLCADTTRGNRPGFERAAFPEDARKLYEEFVTRIREIGIPAQTGIFQADMQVSLLNDGPATFILER
jgi:D-tyrosyl-tRNA(Tyr) deacylase